MKKNEEYRVKMKIGDAEIEVEGAQSGVVKIVEALSDALRGSRKPHAQTALSSPPPIASTAQRSSPIDIRTFFSEKQPSSDLEAAAATAYYYQYLAPENERKESIDSDTLQDAFRLARRPLPAKAFYTLNNARNAGYLDSGAGPGLFRLNPVGYNLVEHGLGPSRETEKPKKKSAKPHKRATRK